MTASVRRYRLDASRAPRLLHELFRRGRLERTETEAGQLFDSPDRELRGLGRTLALRGSGGGVELVMRPLASTGAEADGARVVVGEGDVEGLLGHLGLQPYAHWTLQADTWAYGDATLRVEHFDRLGWFCEISAPEGEEQVASVAGEFGFTESDSETREPLEIMAGPAPSAAPPTAAAGPAPAPGARRGPGIGPLHLLAAGGIVLVSVLLFGPAVGSLVALAVIAAGAIVLAAVRVA